MSPERFDRAQRDGGLRDRAAARALGLGFEQLVRRGLRGVWLRGELPTGPVVLAANHHSWWDGFVVLGVLRHQRRSGALLMDAGNLSRFAFLRQLGVVSHSEVRAALAAARSGRVLVVFPEGQLRPAGPVGPLAPGACWFARRAPAPLVVAAVRLVIRGHEAPEAYVHLVPIANDQAGAGDQARLAAAFDAALGELDAQLQSADPELPLPGFTKVSSGRRDWNERLEAMARRTRR